MKFSKIIIPIVVLLVGVLVAALIVLMSKPEERAPSPPKVKQVEVIPAEYVRYQIEVPSQGFVVPRTETKLSAEVSGRVIRTADNFYVGEFIPAGTILVELDAADYEADVRSAEARLAAEQLRLAQEEARGLQAKREWERTHSKPASDLTLRVPQMREARASVAAAKADVQLAQRNLQRTQVRAPFDALIHEKAVEVGQYVSPSMQLATLYAIDYAEVRLPIVNSEIQFLDLPTASNSMPESELLKVNLVGNFGGLHQSWEATIVRTENVIDAQTRSLYAVARVPDPYGVLHPGSLYSPLPIGLFVEAKIQSRDLPPTVRVPRSLLRGRNQLIIVDTNNRLAVREVTVTYAGQDYVYISEGVSEGEFICMTSSQAMLAGTQVKINLRPAQTNSDD